VADGLEVVAATVRVLVLVVTLWLWLWLWLGVAVAAEAPTLPATVGWAARVCAPQPASPTQATTTMS
jgi:hypothetical protein